MPKLRFFHDIRKKKNKKTSTYQLSLALLVAGVASYAQSTVYLTREENDPTDMLKRIDKQHGTHTIDWAEHIGLGTKKYTIVNIDKK